MTRGKQMTQGAKVTVTFWITSVLLVLAVVLFALR